jgi:hypothetical protein
MSGLELLAEDSEGRSQADLNAREYAHHCDTFLVIWMLGFVSLRASKAALEQLTMI